MTARSWQDAPPGEFAVCGDPVGHSWSPKIHTAALEALGRPERYFAFQVPQEEFVEAMEYLRSVGYIGVNCTVPLKQAAFEWAETVDDASRKYGAVNTLRLGDRSGTNTDAPGFLETLRELQIEPPGPVLVLGAGGTSRTLCVALVDAGYEISVFNRTPEKAYWMLDEVGLNVPVVDFPVVGKNRLLLNTTSAGLSGESLDIAWGQSSHSVVAYDLLYAAEPTPFLSDAMLVGCRIVDGRFMLVAQGALSLEWWLGVNAPRSTMLQALP